MKMLLEKLFLIILLSCIKASKVSNRFNNNERVKAGLQQPKVGGGTTIESISWGYTTESDPEDGSATFSYNFSHQISTSNISHGIPGKNNNRKFYTEGSDTYGFPKIPKVRQPLRVQRAKLIHPKRVKACPLGKALLKQKTRQSKAFDNDARRLVDFEDYEQDEMELESEDEKDEEEDQDDISFDKEDNSDSNSNGDGEDNELDNEKGQSALKGPEKVQKGFFTSRVISNGLLVVLSAMCYCYFFPLEPHQTHSAWVESIQEEFVGLAESAEDSVWCTQRGGIMLARNSRI